LKNNQDFITNDQWFIFWFYFKTFISKSIDRRNTLFHWQSYQFNTIVSCRSIIGILCQMLAEWFILWFYFKMGAIKPIDRRNTLFHWQSYQFNTLVSCRTIRILLQLIIYFLILFQDLWMKINWQEKYPLQLAILPIYKNCKL
jgi:hypothetical protein